MLESHGLQCNDINFFGEICKSVLARRSALVNSRVGSAVAPEDCSPTEHACVELRACISTWSTSEARNLGSKIAINSPGDLDEAIIKHIATLPSAGKAEHAIGGGEHGIKHS